MGFNLFRKTWLPVNWLIRYDDCRDNFRSEQMKKLQLKIRVIWNFTQVLHIYKKACLILCQVATSNHFLSVSVWRALPLPSHLWSLAWALSRTPRKALLSVRANDFIKATDRARAIWLWSRQGRRIRMHFARLSHGFGLNNGSGWDAPPEGDDVCIIKWSIEDQPHFYSNTPWGRLHPIFS